MSMWQNNSTSAFGQTQGFGNQPTQIGTGSGFGSSMASQTSAFGGLANASGGLFGQTQSSAPGGLFGQPAQQNQSGFGGAPSAFGQPTQNAQGGLFGSSSAPATSGFNNMLQPSSNFGVQPQNSAFGQVQQSSGLFGQQSASSFGQAGFGGQPLNTSGFLGGGQGLNQGFSNTNQQLGNNQAGFFGQPGQQFQQPQETQGTKMIYSEPHHYPQQLTSIGKPYQPKPCLVDGSTMTFSSIKTLPDFDRASVQQLRLSDMLHSKGQPSVNYEFVASQEFNQQPQKYALLQNISNIVQQNPQQTGGQRIVTNIVASSFNTTAFGQSSGLGSMSQQSNQWGGGAGFANTSGFNQPQNNQAQTNNSFVQSTGGLFQNQNQGAGLFGQPQANQAGANLTGSSVGLFGQVKQTGGSGLFGQSNAPTSSFSTGATGGLFGSQNNQPLGGLLNQNQAPQASTGLFGQNQTPQQPSNSLFGIKPAASNPISNLGGGGLFGGNPPAQPNSGGLFGNTGTLPGAGSNLFQQPQAQPANNLFSQPAQAAQPGGLFGSNQATNPNLFGGIKPPASGGLFSAQPATGGGLFGTNSAPQLNLGGGGLFAQAPQGGGLFNTQQQQQNAAAPGPQYIDLYSVKDPYGIENSFIQKDYPLENIVKQIEENTKQLEKRFSQVGQSDQVKSAFSSSTHDDPLLTRQPSMQQSANSTVYEDEMNRQRAKENAKYESLYREQQRARENLKKVTNKQSLQVQDLYRSDKFSKSTSNSTEASLKPDLSKRKNQIEQTTAYETAIDTYKIVTQIEIEGNIYEESFQLHKSRDTSDLLQRVHDWLKKDFKFYGSISELEVSLNGQIIQQKQSLSEAKITGDATLQVEITSIPELHQKKNERKKSEQKPINQESELVPIVASDLVPKKPKEGYTCVPPFEVIEQMTVEQLRSVENFTVKNQFGSVLFLDKTDITEVDLADIITIIQGTCEVYDDERHVNTKPEVGKKLNKPAIITLMNLKPSYKKNQTLQEKERKLKEILGKKGATFISYDPKNNFKWEFRVEHFTKWGDDTDEDMEDQNEAERQNIQHERSAFEEISDQVSNHAPAVERQPQPDVEMNAGIPQLLQQSIVDGLSQSSQKQRKVLQPRPLPDNQLARPVGVLPSFLQVIRPPQPRRIQDSNESSTRILETIKQRKQVFSMLQPLETPKPQNMETIDYLTKNLGIQNLNLNKSSLVRRGVVRPCFHPSGTGLLRVEGRNISMITIPETQTFSLQPLLQLSVQVSNPSEQINQHFQSLSISNAQVDQHMQYENEVCKTTFKDEFFRKLLEKPISEASLFNGRQSIYDFLKNAGNHFIKEIKSLKSAEQSLRQVASTLSTVERKREEAKAVLRRKQLSKLDQEFNVICLLNALFGNPNLHLVQLHPQYKGPQNLDRAEHLNLEIAEDSIVMCKKRRNAVTEVFKFVCEQKFPIQSDSLTVQNDKNIYKTALSLLEVGNLRGCVKFLNSKKKTRVSLVLSQCVSNTAAMAELRKLLDESDRADNGASDVLEFVTGKTKNSISWEKSFLSALMYEKCHTQSLAQIIMQIQGQFQQKKIKEESLMWKLLLVYARVKESEQALCEMKGANLLQDHEARDYRIRWVTLLVMRKALAENQIERERRSDNKWSPHVPDEVLCDFSVKYIHQLLSRRNQNDEQAITEACFVAYLIPIAKYRKRVLFEILMHKPENLVCKINLPEDYLSTARALRFQSTNQSSKAIETWIKVGNHSQAERILRQDYLPLRVEFCSDLTTILKFYKPPNLFNEQSVSQSNSRRICDDYIEKIKQKYIDQQAWNQTLCGLYKRTQRLVEAMTKERPAFDLIQRELNEILSSLDGQDSESFVVEWIRIQLGEVATVLAHKSAEVVKDSHKNVEGLPKDQARRYSTWQLQEGLVQLASSAV